MRRCLYVLLILSGIPFLPWEGYRSFLAFLLWRGDYARLERWGGDDCFIPAVTRLYDPCGKKASCQDPLAAWATRRFHSRFPAEEVYDLAWLPTNELVLLLGIPPWEQSKTRLVVLNLEQSEKMTAEVDLLDLNTHGFDLQYFSGWDGPVILAHTWGTGDCALLLRLQRNSFSVLQCKGSREVDPYFLCWLGLHLVDTDGDGVPEVQGCVGKDATCPNCGRDAEYNLVTWKLVDGAYRKWTERGAECGLRCELAWSN